MPMTRANKIRLVGGPFGGKVMEDPNLYGRNDIVMRGPKKMTRKQQYEFFVNNDRMGTFPRPGFADAFPRVEARYELCVSHFGDGVTMVMAPMRHPDGSLFYKYIEGSKREY